MRPVLIVGRVPFLVCAPFFHRTLAGVPGMRFVDGSPRRLNGLLASGRIDCAPSSCLEYARRHRDYLLLPGISTSSRCEMKSVLFLARRPWEELDGLPVRLSEDSATSNALFLLLSRRRFGVRPAPDAAGPEACRGRVCIGDIALREALSGRWPYRYDLAGEWYRWHNLPFSFGLWIVRARAAEHPMLPALMELIRASMAAFPAAARECLAAWERVYPSGIDAEAALDFFSTADYALTPAHERSLHLFFSLVRDEGLLAEAPPLRYVRNASSVPGTAAPLSR